MIALKYINYCYSYNERSIREREARPATERALTQFLKAFR